MGARIDPQGAQPGTRSASGARTVGGDNRPFRCQPHEQQDDQCPERLPDWQADSDHSGNGAALLLGHLVRCPNTGLLTMANIAPADNTSARSSVAVASESCRSRNAMLTSTGVSNASHVPVKPSA